MRADNLLRSPSGLCCPECHCALWQIENGSMLRYRRHVEHAFAADRPWRHKMTKSNGCWGPLCVLIRNVPHGAPHGDTSARHPNGGHATTSAIWRL